MSKNINRLFCHRCSGADYVVRSIMANFICDDFDICYWTYDSHMYKAIEDSDIILYVLRDGRDVMVELYNYFLGQPGTKRHFENINFRQFIMGHSTAATDDWIFDTTAATKNPLISEMFIDPITYWVNHVNSYIDSNVEKMYFVNYDMMLVDAVGMLMHIGDYFKLVPRTGIIYSLEELLLYKPILKDLGQWRSVFKEKDLQYFWGKAEELMIKLKFSYN